MYFFFISFKVNKFMIVEKPHWAFRTVNDYPCGKFIICMTYVLYTSSCILVKKNVCFLNAVIHMCTNMSLF